MYSYSDNVNDRENQERLRSTIRSSYATLERPESNYDAQNDGKPFDEILSAPYEEYNSVDAEAVEENEDLRPSGETLSHRGEYKNGYYKAQNKFEVESVSERYKLTTSGKIVIAVYVFIMVLVLSIVAFNAKYLRGVDNKIQNTQKEVVEMIEKVEKYKARLEEVSSDETIIKTAKDKLNMVERSDI